LLYSIYGFLAGDVPRVNGQLAVARAFGDQSLKAHLSSEPDIRHVPINSTIEFVILASDGLWKVCTRICLLTVPFTNLFFSPCFMQNVCTLACSYLVLSTLHLD
jgi:hypothetical protein